MHYSAGDKVIFRLIWQDYDGKGFAPSSFSVSLQEVNVDTGVEAIVSPTLIGAANSFTGVYVYYYTVQASGNYSYCARGVTDDIDAASMEIFGEFESGRSWVESAASAIEPDIELDDDENTLTIFAEDGETPIAVYDCENAEGDPAHRNIKRFRRRLT